MSFTVTYSLEGTGWAKCTLSDGDSSCEISASYLSDALRRLVIGATAIASGFKAVSFGFDEEPGEFRWVLESVQLNLCSLEILEFPQLQGNRPNSEGKSMFRVEVRPVVFAQAVEVTVAALLERHGTAGYEKLWSRFPFPMREYEALTAAIGGAENAV